KDGKRETVRPRRTFPASPSRTGNVCLPGPRTRKRPSNKPKRQNKAEDDADYTDASEASGLSASIRGLFLAEFSQRTQGSFDCSIERVAATETDMVTELSAR